jgi:hypothetical protein
MNIDRAYEKAEDDLISDYNAGLIDRDAFNAEMRDLARDYRAEAQAAAQDAYDAELDRW